MSGTAIRTMLRAAAASITASALFAAAPAGALAQTFSPERPQAYRKPQDPGSGSAAAAAQARAQAPSVQRSVSAGGGPVIAKVGDTDLREESVRAFIASLSAREQEALARDPALLSQMVRSILANQLVLKEALAKRWDERPEVAEQIQRARDLTIVESYLRQVSEPPAGFPGEAEIQSVYDANKTAFLVPRQFLVAQIYVALPGGADKAAAEKAARKFAEVQLKLRQPNADFAAIARADSDAKETAGRGGEIGWLPETQLRPEIKAQVLGLAKGAVSDPVKLDDGWHIVKLIDTKPAYTRPLSEVRDALAKRIREEQASANRRAYLAELLKKNPPAINELELAKLVSATGQDAAK
ncbi:MAG TPA: peptidylprolyl isomerase [Methylocella sp.]|nr:peptidylprolyl isomerase [Methylocella sp.]